MKMSKRICLIFLRNDCIAPFQMQQYVLRTVISTWECVLHVSCRVHQCRNVTGRLRLRKRWILHFNLTHASCHHDICCLFLAHLPYLLDYSAIDIQSLILFVRFHLSPSGDSFHLWPNSCYLCSYRVQQQSAKKHLFVTRSLSVYQLYSSIHNW